MTAQSLIKSALRTIGVIATGETPEASELTDGLEAMKMMFRNWSSQQIRLYYVSLQDVTLTGAAYYTIGSGGDIACARPVSIHGGMCDDFTVRMIDRDLYQALEAGGAGGAAVEYAWYNPEYPLGKVYVYPTDGTLLTLNCLLPLTEPAALTSDVSFPPEYDEAIKWNLAIRLAPEYGKEAGQTVTALAMSTLRNLETLNFAGSMAAARVDAIAIPSTFDIEYG